MAILENDDDVAPRCLYIEPPDPAVHTDEDSANEDEGGLVNNLSGRQLNARCELSVSTTARTLRTRKRCRSPIPESDSEDDTGLETVCSGQGVSRGRGSSRSRGSSRGRGSSRSRGSTRRRGASRGVTGGCGALRGRGSKRGRDVPEQNDLSMEDSSGDSDDENQEPVSKRSKSSHKWVTEDLPDDVLIFPECDYSAFRGKSPTEMFELFIDDSVVKLLVQESTKYAAFLNCPNPKITDDEMRAFLAILILSGYNPVPSKILYWDQHDDVRNVMVYNSMRRDRFKTIMRFLHFADNTSPNMNDKMWKMRPLIDILKNKFHEHYVPVPTLNYDESMIEYFGKHGCKQFIRGKPIRFGFKNWCLNTPKGYLVDFEIYQGKSIVENPEYDKKFGKAAAPLMKMIDNMPSTVQMLPMRFYFDNLFTSFHLLTNLKERGYQGTGTVRENRLPKDIPLQGSKSMLKTAQRGDSCFTQSEEQKIIVVRWKDNSVVTAMSTVHGVSPAANVSRYSATEKKVVQVPRPAIFTQYNKFMGGTDLMDQNVNTYRISIRGKKWWWCIFSYLIDVSICNAWVLTRQAGDDINQLDFRRQIVQTYLTRYRNMPRKAGRTATSKQSRTGNRVSDDIRYDGRNHLLVPCQEGVRRKCAAEFCKSQTRLQCLKCDVGLCASCNYNFHT